MIGEICRRLVRGRRILHERPEWRDLAGADWAERIMQVEVTDRFHAKQGRSIGRWTLGAGRDRAAVYLKRHFRLPRQLGWLATICPWRSWSPGAREWEHLQWAERAGVPVPKVVAAGELVGPWGRLQSFLAVEELAGMIPLHEAIPLAEKSLTSAVFMTWKRGLTAEMVRLVRILHERNRFHQDLYLCHFYVAKLDTDQAPAEWKNHLHLIDFHRLRHRPMTPFLGRAKDLAQLLYSARIDGVTARDCLRFWCGYCAGRDMYWLQRAVLWRSRRYAKHNRKPRRVFDHVANPRTALEHRVMS